MGYVPSRSTARAIFLATLHVPSGIAAMFAGYVSRGPVYLLRYALQIRPLQSLLGQYCPCLSTAQWVFSLSFNEAGIGCHSESCGTFNGAAIPVGQAASSFYIAWGMRSKTICYRSAHNDRISILLTSLAVYSVQGICPIPLRLSWKTCSRVSLVFA